MKQLLSERTRRVWFLALNMASILFWGLFLSFDLSNPNTPTIALIIDVVFLIISGFLSYFEARRSLAAHRLVVAARKAGIK